MKKRWRIAGISFLITIIVAAAALHSTGTRQPEYQGRKLTEWLEDLRNPSPLVRTNATLALRQMGTNTVPCLVEMLRSKDSAFKVKFMDLVSRQRWVDFHFRYDFQRRDDALRGLGALGPLAKAASPEVARLLDNRAEAGMAAYTLHQIGPETVPLLTKALTSSNQWARSRAARVLGVSGADGKQVVPGLLAALKGPDILTKSTAARALTRFPDQADIIVPALIASLKDPDPTFRSNVARALGLLAEKAKPAIPTLIKLVESADYHESMAAVGALMKIDARSTLETLTNNLVSVDANVRKTSARGLGLFKTQGEPAVVALVACLKDADKSVRIEAAVALREIAQEPDLVVPALMENLKDPDLKVRSITAIALCPFGEKAKQAVPSILKLIEENKGDELTVQGLFNALADIDPQAAKGLTGD